MKKKVFAVILAAALCVGLLPASVLAETEGASAEQEIELMSQDSAESDEETSEEGEDAGLFAVQDEDSEEVSDPEETESEIQTLDAGDEELPEDEEEIQTLAYELPEGATGKVVINLGNGNGVYNFADYTGSRQEGTLLRYTTDSLVEYADDKGNLTINLPSDTNLGAAFTVVNADTTNNLDAVTVELGRELAYDYKLIGWVNIATGEYYDVSDGTTTVEINLENENVFYADWIAASYDHGSSSDADLRTDTVSTKDFVTMHMYDYNDLFNMYSESVEQNVEMEVGENLHLDVVPEDWTDSGTMYNTILGKQNGSKITNSFLFVNNGTTGYSSTQGEQKTGGMLSWPNYKTDGDTWTGSGKEPRDAYKEWGIDSPNSAPLNMLFDTSASSTGVHYVGEADYLFWLDEDGYYTYNSKEAAATYNQSEGRFYVYDGEQAVTGTDFSCFLPYNTYGSELSALDGSVNYWFGMDMEVNFYLPSAAGTGGNLVDGKNMVFNFSGDDDILIFIDDELVLDMSGIHDESFGSIDFTEGTVKMAMSETGLETAEPTSLNLSSGNHSLRVYYMERGGYASNLEVQFNVAPLWDYVTGDVQTVTAEKVWQDSDGNTLDPEDLKGSYAKSVEVGLFDALEPATEDTFGYTIDGEKYIVEYSDNNEVTHTYIYDTSGPTLTYIEDNNEVVYSKVNSSGQIVDNDGYVIAWLTESTQGDGAQTLHIRIDQQTLSSENDWYYAWELLDPDGAYEVLELSENSNYISEIEKNNLTSYKYWSVIGDKEIEQNLENKDFTIILTDAAQQTSENIGDTKEALGWVIVGTANGIETQQVAFSQIATLTSEEQDGTTFYEGTYGVTSQSEIEALGPGALWYVEDSEHQDDDVTGGQVEGFYLYCVLDDGNTYYLTVDENGSTLTTTTSENGKSEFYYDSLGELRVVRDGDDRVIISADGEVGLAEAVFEADTNDGRIYTYTDTATSGFAATITNTVEVVDISGEKIWDDYDNEYNTRPDSITIHLYADDVEIDQVTVTSDDDWTWSFTGLPKYNDETSTEITYTITEDAVPGYTTDIDGFTVTNTLETVDIEGAKTWVGDSDDKYGTRQSITIHLLADGTEVDRKTVTSDDDWAWSFTGLPKYSINDGTATEITYTITEDAVPGYTTEVSGYDVTNTLVTTEVSGEKTWVDEDNANNTRPESITIYLYADGVQTGDTAVVTSSDNWKWTFTDLPKYQSDGVTEIIYTIMEGETEEGHLGEYIPSYSEDGLSVTNAIPEVSKYVSDPTFGESTDDDLKEDETENNNTLEYKMEADHIGNAQNLVLHDLLDDQLDMSTLQIVSVTLYEEESTDGRSLTEGVDYTVSTGECSADCGLDGCSFEIHVKDDDLKGLSSDAYVIVIFDIQVQEDVEDFDGNYVDEIDNFVGLSFFSYYATPDEVETYSYGFDLYKYDADTDEPLEGVEFVLSKAGDDGTVYAQFDVIDETYLLSGWADSKDDATAIVTGSDGKAIVEGLHDGTFSIEETKAPDGYQQKVGTMTVTITVDENDPENPTITATNATVSGMDVQISNTPGSDTIEIIGSKTWDDGDNADGIRPDSITIHLLADGEEVDSATVTADDNWAWSFKDLPIYDSYGNEINYTITENEIDGYTDSVNNYNVTNTHEYETRDISGSKTWDDDNDKADARPVSITVNLYQDGELYDSKIVTAADDWAWSWNDLPKNKNGEAIVYTVDEDEVEYYTPSYESGSFDITNTFIGEEGAEHPNPDKGGDVPKTGDNNNFLLWALVMLLCGLIVGETYLIRKRRR